MTQRASEGPTLSLRHTVATLAYRASKVLRDSPQEFSSFRSADGTRSAGEILSHMCDLFDWALSMAQGSERWNNSRPRSWDEDTERFFAALTAFDLHLASDEKCHTPPEALFQGPVADALTHVGQIALMRRLAGGPIRPENYSVAKIESGATGATQNKPVREYGAASTKG